MKNIAVLVSGGGTNLQALIDAEKRGEIKNGKINCVISSNPDAYALNAHRITVFIQRLSDVRTTLGLMITTRLLPSFCKA